MLVFEERLYSMLAQGSALTTLLHGTAVYNELGPAGTAITYPLVIFTKSSGRDDNDTPHRAKTLLYQVTAISDQGKKEAMQIDNAVDGLLEHSEPGSMSGWYGYWLARESDVSYVEQVPGGKVLWHEGGIYRVRIASKE